MIPYYEAIKSLITSAMLTDAASVVNEKESRVASAVNAMIASFLGVFLKWGDNAPQIESVLSEAGNLNILERPEKIFADDPSLDQQRLGDAFTEALLGNKAVDFSTHIAHHERISEVAANKLVSMIAPIVAGFLGREMTKNGETIEYLIRGANVGRADMAILIPPLLVSSFGIAPAILDATAQKKSRKKRNTIIWIIVILLLLLLILWRKSCGCCKADVVKNEPVVVAEKTTADAKTATDVKTLKLLTLPNGVKLNAYEGSVEDNMIRFIESGKLKDATDEELKQHWFQFDKVRFVYNSATELMDGSEAELDNIAAILNYYADVKVKLGAYADHRGTEKVNLEISKERAKTIEKLLEQRGVGSQIVKAEGYGEEYAVYPTDASDTQRSVDRDIALRFAK